MRGSAGFRVVKKFKLIKQALKVWWQMHFCNYRNNINNLSKVLQSVTGLSNQREFSSHRQYSRNDGNGRLKGIPSFVS